MAYGFGPDTIVHRLRSEPIKVHWAGFESDTYKMQQAGWTVSAYEDVACMLMQLAFSRDGGQFTIGQPNKLKGISSRFPFDYRRNMGDPRSYYPREEIVAEIMAVGSRVHIHEHSSIDISAKFHPVDATPQMWQGKITGLDDYGHFVPKGNVVQPEDIIVPADSVEELLAKILTMQQGAKVARATAQYYDEKESGLLVPRVAAKILTLDEYRKAG